MAVMGFLEHFATFFALLRFSGVERQFSQLGGLDDEEFFVIEGWWVALTPGVILPGVRPPVVHELVASLALSAGSCGCGQTHTLTSLPTTTTTTTIQSGQAPF